MGHVTIMSRDKQDLLHKANKIKEYCRKIGMTFTRFL
jgi:hypothetical protein